MAEYKYQQNLFEGASYGYVKYNIEPDFGTPIAAGETVKISGQLYCRSMAIKSMSVETIAVGTNKFTTFNMSVPKATAKTFEISFPMWALSDSWGTGRLVSAPISFTFWSGADYSGDGLVTVMDAAHAISFLRYRIYVAAKTLTFERCALVGDAYESNDEGTFVRGSLALSMSAGHGAADIETARVSVSGSDGTDQTMELSGGVLAAALGVGGYSETAPSLFAGISFDTAHNYSLSFVIGDDYDTYSFRFTVARSFANMHLSGRKNGGVAFGRFSSATDDAPKFECDYPAYFYGGIAQIGDGTGSLLALMGIQTGSSAAQSVTNSKTADVEVSFGKAYSTAPVVVANIVSESTSYYLGRCNVAIVSVTTTGFTARLANGGSAAVEFGFNWAAFGTLA